MEAIPTKLTHKLVLGLDELVGDGWYSSRSEAIRAAVRELIEKKKLEILEEAIEEDIRWGLYGKD